MKRFTSSPVFEEDQGRDAHNAVGSGEIRCLVNVHFADVIALSGQLLQDRSLTHTGTAPGCPEVYEDFLLAFDGFIEITAV